MYAAIAETETFLDRVYQGSLSMMVSAMTQKKAVSKEELDELYALLRQIPSASSRPVCGARSHKHSMMFHSAGARSNCSIVPSSFPHFLVTVVNTM